MNETPIQEHAILATLSPAMRRALMTARPSQAEPEWDTLADYCQGHEGLDGAHMAEIVYCEGQSVCDQARVAYDRDRDPDPDRKVITVSPGVPVGTVVALIGRGLVEHAANARTRDHVLTDRGLRVLVALKAMPPEEQMPSSGYTTLQRRRAYRASLAAKQAATHAAAHGRYPQRSAEAMAALLDYLADSGDTSPATLHALARAMRDC